MATILRCESTGCAHNDDGKCTLDEIVVTDEGTCEQEEI